MAFTIIGVSLSKLHGLLSRMPTVSIYVCVLYNLPCIAERVLTSVELTNC